MQPDGTIAWLTGQPEELPAAKGATAETSTGSFSGLMKAGGSGRAFDEGDLPALDFPTHPRPVAAPKAEQEPEPGKPTANDGDA